MEGQAYLDIYERQVRNRRRFRLAVAAYVLVVMAILLIFIPPMYWIYHEVKGIDWIYLWLVIGISWLAVLFYSMLRFLLGGRWLLKGMALIPPSWTDRRLRDALESVLLATGGKEKVRMFVIPSPAVNAFSLYLKDGSYALFVTRGVADKLAASEREVIIAHEFAHMQGGDALLHTAMLRLVGRNAFFTGMQKALTITTYRKDKGPTRRRISIQQIEKPNFLHQERGLRVGPPPLAMVALIIGLIVSTSVLGAMGYEETAAFLALAAMDSFVFLAFPSIMYALFQAFLDQQRDFFADMKAVFITRDPSAVYSALKSAGDDDQDRYDLPSYLDELVFNPPLYHISYKVVQTGGFGYPIFVDTTPYHHQPLLMDRMRNLRKVFPQVASDTARHVYTEPELNAEEGPRVTVKDLGEIAACTGPGVAVADTGSTPETGDGTGRIIKEGGMGKDVWDRPPEGEGLWFGDFTETTISRPSDGVEETVKIIKRRGPDGEVSKVESTPGTDPRRIVEFIREQLEQMESGVASGRVRFETSPGSDPKETIEALRKSLEKVEGELEKGKSPPPTSGPRPLSIDDWIDE
jgi:Zn-dependent protease with chaperone function